MRLADNVLAVSNNLPIKTRLPVHSGKVRSVYWLDRKDSQRLIQERGYNISENADLAVMVISDRISAFDCNWKSEDELSGIPGKGAALNSISAHWFELFKKQGLADSHILEVPHPLVWIVQKARPLMIEGIARQYITGSMWRAYNKGERTFCGIRLDDGLQKNQRLNDLLITPSTKGIMKGIPDVPEVDDCAISRSIIENNLSDFGFSSPGDVDLYEKLLCEGFQLITEKLANVGQILVDTKFEFGYVEDKKGQEKLIYMDEVGTPDSSRFWEMKAYQQGHILERSKENFRQQLMAFVDDADVLINSDRMNERIALSKSATLPLSMFTELSTVYKNLAEAITGEPVPESMNTRQSIIDVLDREYGLIQGK